MVSDEKETTLSVWLLTLDQGEGFNLFTLDYRPDWLDDLMDHAYLDKWVSFRDIHDAEYAYHRRTLCHIRIERMTVADLDEILLEDPVSGREDSDSNMTPS